MVGGGIQRTCVSVFRTMVPSFEGAEGSVARGTKGKGRGKGDPKGPRKGGPKGQGRSQMKEPVEKEELQEDDSVQSVESLGAEEEGEEEEDTTGGDSSMAAAVWLRGPSRLPDRRYLLPDAW